MARYNIKYVDTYYGVDIYYNPTAYTNYEARLPNGELDRADTLANIKKLIKFDLKAMGFKVRK